MPNKGTAKRRAPKGVLGRLIRTLFGFYPVLLPVTVACILFNAVVSSVPSIFMQNVIASSCRRQSAIRLPYRKF